MKLLIPVDGSDAALRAIGHAGTLRAAGAAVEVVLLNVQPSLSADISRFVSRDLLSEYHEEQGRLALAGAEAALSDAGIEFKAEVRVGNGAATIAEQAREHGCDAIVMATAGLGGVIGVLLGSTAQRVVHLADVPVTLVK